MAFVHQLGFLKLKILTAVHFTDAFCITVPNFMEIGRTVAAISQFREFFTVAE